MLKIDDLHATVVDALRYQLEGADLDHAAHEVLDRLRPDWASLGLKGDAGLQGTGGDPAQTSVPASRAGLEGSAGIEGQAKAVMSAP